MSSATGCATLDQVLTKLGGTRIGVWVIGKLISPFQRWVIRTTGGKLTLTRKPVLLLTATGRRSGLPRTVPLLYLRDDDDLIVCNVRPPGERRNPWPINVRAGPQVAIRIKGKAEQRLARDAQPDEIERLWPRLVDLWPAYERFFAQTHERAIFVLEPRNGQRAPTLPRPSVPAAG
jgi:F420H(2)-dependent quinone reductase